MKCQMAMCGNDADKVLVSGEKVWAALCKRCYRYNGKGREHIYIRNIFAGAGPRMSDAKAKQIIATIKKLRWVDYHAWNFQRGVKKERGKNE